MWPGTEKTRRSGAGFFDTGKAATSDAKARTRVRN